MVTYRATFETITPDMRTRASVDDKTVYAHGALPGESATVAIVHTRGQRHIAQPIHIHTRHPHRVSPHETHYQLCSPWQIMSYSYQCQVKHRFLIQALSGTSYTSPFIPSPVQFGYRTAIGYGFTKRASQLELAMRGHESTTALPHGCLLASTDMNRKAQAIRDVLRTLSLSPSPLLRLVLRESKAYGETIAALYTYEATFPPVPETFLTQTGLSGFTVYQTDPKSSVPAPVQELFHIGNRFITDKILSLDIAYPVTAFFQNNVPLYEQVLTDLNQNLSPYTHVLDTYAGVGTIGLSLAHQAQTVTAIEISSSMTAFTQQNAKTNHIKNVSAHTLAAEAIPSEMLEAADLVIVNPTRKGLHASFVQQLLSILPDQIAYLSCNIGTLERDLGLLSARYKITFARGYDFYPNTPHQESLVILKRM